MRALKVLISGLCAIVRLVLEGLGLDGDMWALISRTGVGEASVAHASGRLGNKLGSDGRTKR